MTAAPEAAAPRERRTPPRGAAALDGAAVLLGCLDGAAAAVAAALVGLPGLLCACYGAAVVGVLAADGSYRPRLSTFVGPSVPRLAGATTLPLALLVLLAQGRSQPWVPVAAVALAALLVPTVHVGVGAARRRHHRRSAGDPVVVVGAGPTGLGLAAVMRDRPDLGLDPVGFLDDAGPASVGPDGAPWLGPVADLPEIVRRHGVHRVVVAFAAGAGNGGAEDSTAPPGLEGALHAARETGARVWVVPRLPRTGVDVPLGRLDDLWGTALLPLRPVPQEGAPSQRVRRAGEVLLASLLLVLTGPVVLLAAVLGGPARLAGAGPAFFRQWRIGRAGKPVRVVKLRTVVGPGDEAWAVPEQRVTAWGRLLRRTHVDELPQLLGVLRGDLALVGPRPERPVFAALFARTVPGYLDRLRVGAGLTGWAQVHGLCGDTSVPDRARFDSQYVEYRSIWLDTVILLRTLAALPTAPARGTAAVPVTPGGRP